MLRSEIMFDLEQVQTALIHVINKKDLTLEGAAMNFRRPFRAELVGKKDIWIVDADGAFVTKFPGTSDDIATDLKRAEAVAKTDKGKDF